MNNIDDLKELMLLLEKKRDPIYFELRESFKNPALDENLLAERTIKAAIHGALITGMKTTLEFLTAKGKMKV